MPISMSKGSKIWIGRSLKDDRVENSKTLKGICGVLGVSYNTAKKKQDRVGGKTVWEDGKGGVWEVWLSKIG